MILRPSEPAAGPPRRSATRELSLALLGMAFIAALMVRYTQPVWCETAPSLCIEDEASPESADGDDHIASEGSLERDDMSAPVELSAPRGNEANVEVAPPSVPAIIEPTATRASPRDLIAAPSATPRSSRARPTPNPSPSPSRPERRTDTPEPDATDEERDATATPDADDADEGDLEESPTPSPTADDDAYPGPGGATPTATEAAYPNPET